MVNHPRISTVLVEESESLEHLFARITADGIVTPHEAAEMSRQLQAHTSSTSYVDETIATSVAVLRRGPNSVRVQRLTTERKSRETYSAT